MAVAGSDGRLLSNGNPVDGGGVYGDIIASDHPIRLR